MADGSCLWRNLGSYGAGFAGAYPIYGLRPVELMGDDFWSVVAVTNEFRSQGVPGTDRWIVFSDDQACNPVGMDKDGKVWIHDHDFGGIALLENSFEDYLRNWCLDVD